LQAIRGLDNGLGEEQFNHQAQHPQIFPSPNIGQQPQCPQMLDPPICPKPPAKRQQQIGNKRDQTQRQQKHPKQQTTDTLDAAFRKRFFALSSSSVDQQIAANQNQQKGGTTGSSAAGGGGKSLTLNRRTLKALEHRRESIYGRGSSDGGGIKVSILQ
jgi:hypothetical protein